jgi:hypothetical protein
VTVLNEATIVAVTPAGTAGAKAVQVVNPNGNASLAGGFTFQ